MEHRAIVSLYITADQQIAKYVRFNGAEFDPPMMYLIIIPFITKYLQKTKYHKVAKISYQFLFHFLFRYPNTVENVLFI